jgi:hypothetical protein
MSLENLETPTPPVGVIESLTQGFETAAGHLLLLLLPLVLDLAIWVGPRITFRPAVETLVSAGQTLVTSYIDIWGPSTATMPEDYQQLWREQFAMWVEFAHSRPIQYLPVWGIPSLLSGREASLLPFNFVPPTWQIANLPAMLGIRLLLVVGGLLLGGLYITLIARRVRNDGSGLKQLVARLPSIFSQLAVFIVLAPIVLLILYVPFILIAVPLAYLFIPLGQMVLWIGALVVLWIGLFGVFTIHGMLINDRNLPGAVLDSVRVVQWNMPATMFLFLLVIILDAALKEYVWSLPDTSTWWVLLGMGGRAFIVTGLIAATFVFFKDRYRYWQEMREELLLELERRRAQRSRNQQQ